MHGALGCLSSLMLWRGGRRSILPRNPVTHSGCSIRVGMRIMPTSRASILRSPLAATCQTAPYRLARMGDKQGNTTLSDRAWPVRKPPPRSGSRPKNREEITQLRGLSSYIRDMPPIWIELKQLTGTCNSMDLLAQGRLAASARRRAGKRCDKWRALPPLSAHPQGVPGRLDR